MFTPGRLILAVPSKDTPPIVRAVSNAVAVSALPVTSPVTGPTRDVPVIVVPVIATAELAPIIAPSIAPPLMSTVVNVDVPVAANVVKVPAPAELPPIVTPSIEPPSISAVPATRASILAVPSIYRLRHSEPTAPKSYVSSAEGNRGEATSAVTVTVSLAAFPSVVFPFTVRFPVRVELVSTCNTSIVAVPSRYKSLNCRLDVPKSISLVVTGTIAPS